MNLPTEGDAPSVTPTDTGDPEFVALTRELDRELRGTYGALQDSYDSLNLLPPGLPAAIARADGEAVGCGALKPSGYGAFEVKRVYVRPDWRGKGLAKRVMHALALRARSLGGRRLVLETGSRQAAAIALYEGLGFARIPNFGEYAGNENSLCMAKDLPVLDSPLTTDRLTIRYFRESDGPALHEYLSLPETYRFEPGEPLSPEEANRLARERAAGHEFFAVALRGDGPGGESAMVGHLYFRRTEPYDFGGWELGYIFNPRHRGKGYCTEAARALVAHAFSCLGAHRVYAHCDPRNAASVRVLERLGMREEGRFRKKAFFRKDGEGTPLWHDALTFAVLDEEWP